MKDLTFLKSKRITAGIIAFIMFVAVLFSVFYIAAEAGHDCSGENCPVCVCIQQCEKTLDQMGRGTVCQMAAISPVITIIFVIIPAACAFCQDTLVTRKVRLDN